MAEGINPPFVKNLPIVCMVCIISAGMGDDWVDSRSLINHLKADGWRHIATRGSHWHFKHPDKPGKVTVPHPKRDLPIGTIKSVFKQAQINL